MLTTFKRLETITSDHLVNTFQDFLKSPFIFVEDVAVYLVQAQFFF